jgi:hypothetical protein
MAIFAKSNGGGTTERKVVPAGNHVARCYGMIQIGTVEQEYMGEKKKLHKVMVDFELPMETAVFKEGEEAKPFVISKDFTLSFNEKSTLRKMLESWRGKEFTDQEAANFDITKLVGAPCMLNIVHKASADGTKTYANITGITPMPKGLQCPDQVNPTRLLAYDSWNQEVFMSLPEWLADKISATPEYKAKFTIDTPNQEAFNLDKVEENDALPF